MNGQRIGIAGIGLIGGSIALRAHAAGARVSAYDHDSAALTGALERNAIDASEPDLRSLAAGCELLVIALPLDATVFALEQLAGIGGPDLVIDVASVKVPPAKFGRYVPNYVGTHPMAGRERGGIESADPRLFEGATWAYVPDANPLLIDRARAFIAAMGARALPIDSARHDEIVALTSHLPQVLSVALGAELARAAAVDARVIDLCGTGILSMLRLARSPAAMWSPIVAANAGSLAGNLRSIARALLKAADGLDRGDSSPLMSYFDTARGVASVLEQRSAPVSRF